MTRIVAVHSFRGGTGKSNITANVAGQLAMAGARVGIIDTDIQSPGIHVLFGFADDLRPERTLNEFLAGRATISEAATDVTGRLPAGCPGGIHLVASSISPADISEVLRTGYDVELLNDAMVSLGVELGLDVVLIDTHPGLNDETLLTVAVCDQLIVLMRPDKQDYQGTAVTVDVAARLGVPDRMIVVNKVYAALPLATVAERVTQGFGLPVAAALPLSEEVAGNASAGLFSITEPDHTWSGGLRQVAAAVPWR